MRPPVHTAVWLILADGASSVDMTSQLLSAGSKIPPVFVRLHVESMPPHTSILDSEELHTAVW